MTTDQIMEYALPVAFIALVLPVCIAVWACVLDGLFGKHK